MVGPQLDYSLDDKETKKIAREMIKMVMDINGKYLPATGRTFTDLTRVTCETCHHGLAKAAHSPRRPDRGGAGQRT